MTQQQFNNFDREYDWNDTIPLKAMIVDVTHRTRKIPASYQRATRQQFTF